MKVKWKSVAQSCLPLCDHMDYSPPGPSVRGILQARILEWVAIPFSRGSSWPRDQIWVSSITGGFFNVWATLDINPLLVKLFENSFSLSVDYLIILQIVSFAVQKLLHLIRSHLFTLAFIFALGGWSKKKKYCFDLCQRVYCLCFPLGGLWFPVLLLGL